MPIEPNVSYIADLNISNPPATDPLSQVDEHLRLIKTAVAQSFPNISGVVTATQSVLNGLDGRVSALEGADSAAIANNSGTPSFASGITAGEIRNLIDLGTADNVIFNQVGTGTLTFDNGMWQFVTSGTDLIIKYNNVNRYKFTSSGTFRAFGDVFAASSI